MDRAPVPTKHCVLGTDCLNLSEVLSFTCICSFTAARFEFWFVGYQRFVCTELGVTTGILKQTHHKSELFKVVGSEFVEALFQHSEKIQSLHLTVEDIAILRSFLVVSPGLYI